MHDRLETLLKAILDNELAGAKAILSEDAELAGKRVNRERLYESSILHWIYVGDTALHLAAAGYRVEIAEALLKAGADPNAASNRRASGPLHYAADGHVNGPGWNPGKQIRTLELLVEAGAAINAQDKNGASPLHRAVRTRSSAAVRFLLEAGANPLLRNKPGSTAFHLAVQNTGRGGSGSEAARDEQRAIIDAFLAAPVSTALKDGKGKSIVECANSDWVRELVTGS